jgi:hypothetical protein
MRIALPLAAKGKRRSPTLENPGAMEPQAPQPGEGVATEQIEAS